MKNNKKPISRKEGIVVQEHNGEVLIYDLGKNKALCLNETSSLIWAACDGNNDVSEISRSVGKKLNSPINDDMVWLALDQLKKEDLISNSEEIAPDFNGMSRREVIKKVGLASVIALPIVSGLVAPTAIYAASCGRPCNPGNNPCPVTAGGCNTCTNTGGGNTCQL